MPIKFSVTTQDTKSAVVTTENLSTFQMYAVADGAYVDNATGANHAAGEYFTDVANKEGGSWNMTSPRYWINNVGIYFWCWYPKDNALTTSSEGLRTITKPAAGEGTLSFSYALPTPSSGSDATNQKDLIFAGYSDTRSFDSNSTDDDGKFDLTFYHPLSEVRFAVSPDDDTFNLGLRIKSIALMGIKSSGNCVFTPPHTFAWSDQSEKKNYSQSYEAAFTSAPAGWSTGSYTDASSASRTLYTTQNAFFMIPQALESATLEVVFEKNADGRTMPKQVTLNDTWEPGKYYTYKIKASSVNAYDFDLSVSLWIEGGNVNLY